MAILIHKLKTLNPKKTIAAVGLAGLTAFLVVSPLVSANGPQFNIFPLCYQGGMNCDLPLLDARNATNNEPWSVSQADHDAGVTAAPGDIIEFSVYYHNGVADAGGNTALNAFVQAFANPAVGGAASMHTISAAVGAANAAAVSSSSASRGGDVKINLTGGGQRLSLVPGSLVLFPNQGQTPQPSAQQLPDTIFGSGGVSIGDVRGCFQFHGFVNFKMQVGQAVTGTLGIQKQVRNISTGSAFSDTEAVANPGDTVEYRISVSASNSSVNNVFVRDALDSRLTFNNLLILDGGVINSSGFFSGGGVSIGAVNPNVPRELKFQAMIAPASQFSTGTTILPNVATAFTSQTSVQDGADVRINIPSPISQSRDLSLNKRVLNVSRGETSFRDSTFANPSDRVRFEIRFDTLGNADQTGIVVRDIMPSQLLFVGGTMRLDYFSVYNESELFGSGKYFGTMAAGGSHIITYEATVAGAGAFSGGTTLTNTANVRSNEVGTRQDQAEVLVQLVAGVQFSLQKTAFNVTRGVDATTIVANPGDVISYTLLYRNTGQTTIQGAIIEDDIHDIMELADIVNQGGAVSVNGSIRFAPVDVPAGVEVSRTFQVRVRNASLFPANSDLVMTNIYGNEVRVTVRRPQVAGAVTPPRTGAAEWLPVLAAFLVTAGYWTYRRTRYALG